MGSADCSLQTAAASPLRLHDGRSTRTVWPRPWRRLLLRGRRALDEQTIVGMSQLRIRHPQSDTAAAADATGRAPPPEHQRGNPCMHRHGHRLQPAAWAWGHAGESCYVIPPLWLISPRCWPRVSHEPVDRCGAPHASSQQPARTGPQMTHFTSPRPSIAHPLLSRRSRSLAATRPKCLRARLTSDLH